MTDDSSVENLRFKFQAAVVEEAKSQKEGRLAMRDVVHHVVDLKGHRRCGQSHRSTSPKGQNQESLGIRTDRIEDTTIVDDEADDWWNVDCVSETKLVDETSQKGEVHQRPVLTIGTTPPPVQQAKLEAMTEDREDENEFREGPSWCKQKPK